MFTFTLAFMLTLSHYIYKPWQVILKCCMTDSSQWELTLWHSAVYELSVTFYYWQCYSESCVAFVESFQIPLTGIVTNITGESGRHSWLLLLSVEIVYQCLTLQIPHVDNNYLDFGIIQVCFYKVVGMGNNV